MPTNGVVVRVRRGAGGVDAYGDPIPGAETRATIVDAFTAPRSSADLNEGRQGVIIGLTLYAPLDTDLVHTDLIEVDGVLFAVDGEDGRWLHPFTGWAAGTEVALLRVEG